MFFTDKNTHELLKAWAHQTHKLPNRNEEIKNSVFNHLSSQEKKIASSNWKKIFFHAWKLPALGTAMLLAIVITNQYLRDTYQENLPPAKPSPIEYSDKDSSDGYPDPNNSLGVNYGSATGLASAEPPFVFKAIESQLSKFEETFGTQKISDTREYLKTDYTASIRARHVAATSRRIQTMIRGYGGRIDSGDIQDEYSYIHFAIPQDNLETFRTELYQQTGERFIIESTQFTNLLSQKQNIEKQAQDTEQTLLQIETHRAQETSRHDTNVKNMKQQLVRININIQTVESRLQLEVENDPHRTTDEKLHSSLLNERYYLNQNLQNENANFTRTLNQLNTQKTQAISQRTNLETKNTNLLENIATVNGTITIDFISIPQITDLYIPYSKLWFLILGIVMIWYIKRDRPKFRLP